MGLEMVGLARTRMYFRNMVRRSGNFRSELKWARDELKKANRRNFATQGTTSGEPWNKLDTEYQSWKIEQYGISGLPTMIRSGNLYRDLTTLGGRVNHIGLKSATFGTDLEYAKFHQHGTRFMPARKIIFVPKDFARQLGEKVGDYMVYGSKGMEGYRRIKAVVTD